MPIVTPSPALRKVRSPPAHCGEPRCCQRCERSDHPVSHSTKSRHRTLRERSGHPFTLPPPHSRNKASLSSPVRTTTEFPHDRYISAWPQLARQTRNRVYLKMPFPFHGGGRRSVSLIACRRRVPRRHETAEMLSRVRKHIKQRRINSPELLGPAETHTLHLVTIKGTTRDPRSVIYSISYKISYIE